MCSGWEGRRERKKERRKQREAEMDGGGRDHTYLLGGLGDHRVKGGGRESQTHIS